MEFVKKFPIGSGLQNFHIRTPLVPFSYSQGRAGDIASPVRSKGRQRGRS